MLDQVFDTAEAAPEAVRPFLKQNPEGKFVGTFVPKQQVDEFRNNNIKISQERDSYKEFVEKAKPLIGEDFDKFVTDQAELTELRRKREAGEIKDNDKFEEALKGRTDEMKNEYTNKITNLQGTAEKVTKERDDLQHQLNNTIVTNSVRNAAIDPALGVIPQAMDDVVRRAAEIFRMKDGKITPMNDKNEVLYGANGSDWLTPAEYINRLRESHPHYFKGTQGGGAGGANSAGGSGTNGAYTREEIEKMTQDEYRKARAEGKIK